MSSDGTMNICGQITTKGTRCKLSRTCRYHGNTSIGNTSIGNTSIGNGDGNKVSEVSDIEIDIEIDKIEDIDLVKFEKISIREFKAQIKKNEIEDKKRDELTKKWAVENRLRMERKKDEVDAHMILSENRLYQREKKLKKEAKEEKQKQERKRRKSIAF